jgi:DNA-binding response OmpR family regulator
VVQDDKPLHLVLQDGLKDGGFDVLVIGSAREALARLRSGAVKYSALVTDIELADGRNGWDVTRQARRIDSSLVVVYASGASADDWRAQGVPNSLVLEKPIAPSQLLSAETWLLNGNERV